MKPNTLIILSVCTIAGTIRVPSSWPQHRHELTKTAGAQQSEIGFEQRPHGVVSKQKNYNGRKYVPYHLRHPDPKNHNAGREFKPSAPANGWRPVDPYSFHKKYFKYPLTGTINENPPRLHPPPITNREGKDYYAGNVPEATGTSEVETITREAPPAAEEQDESNEADASETGTPTRSSGSEERNDSSETDPANAEIPTRPAYPGPGKWSQRGTIPKSQKLPSVMEPPPAENPEGHEVFDKIQKVFERQQELFPEKLHSVAEQNKLGAFLPVDEAEPEEDSQAVPEFVPIRVYSQVRKTESDSHHPQLAEDPRLREVIKDSKIQTVYTEEGYEDVEYDHAGHEKNAEESEGDLEFEKAVERNPNDSDASGSSQNPAWSKQHKYQRLKVLAVKNPGGANNGGMEVTSETKLVASPTAGSKLERVVTTFPKTYRYDREPSRRRKRFANDFPIDTDFIDKINHNLPVKAVPHVKEKYPYYNDPRVPADSPLRYAEDLRNIPKKTDGVFAFYEQAEATKCDEVPVTVEPIPERVKNAEHTDGEDDDSEKLVDGPRLRNLGDKIDCFKVKYFGEEPLDSPFFKETTIGPISPLFNTKRKPKKATGNLENEVLKGRESRQLPNIEIIRTTKIKNVLGTMPESKPEHIYHQIAMAEQLPSQDQNKTVEARAGKILTPESEALTRRRKLRPKRPMHIFDINKFLPNPYFERYKTSTISPKHDMLSEVHYKDDIKPSEQLTLLADVMNNIKSSNLDPLQTAASYDRAPTKLNRYDLYHNTISKIKYYDLPQEEKTTTTTTTRKPARGTLKYSSYKNKEDMFNKERDKYENIELLKTKRRKTTTTTEQYLDDEEEDNGTTKKDTEVVGLMPPETHTYKTIFPVKHRKQVVAESAINENTEQQKMNHFYVLGMKPPPLQQKVYLYSDFKTHSSPKTKSYLNRGKRSAQRPSYSAVVRNRNKPIDSNDDTDVEVVDDEEYVPHRPKNYHYDENTGKIVYKEVKKEAEEPEVEYVEVTEAPIPKPSRKKVEGPRFNNFTGPSYVEFLAQVRSHPEYEVITDPPTTEKGKETTTSTTTTLQPVSTEPPEFLSILSKVRKSVKYENIEDKTTKRTLPSIAQEEEKEEDDTQVENVQNSPGGQPQAPNFQIFDINEYLPKTKSYSPRTTIDYSKYKTIERGGAPMKNKDSEEEESPRRRGPIEPPEHKEEDVGVVEATTTVQIQTTEPKKSSRRRGSTRLTEKPEIATPTATEKPKRTYPRRQRTRIRLRPVADEPELAEETTKIVRRRHQRDEDAPGANRTQVGHQARNINNIQVFQRFNRAKPHGGNLKEEERGSETTVKRLTDVVSKPSAYYSDPKLPRNVNQLKEVGREEMEDSGEVASDYDFDSGSVTTTAKPAFIKDPDKRLYYYAPI